MDPARVAVAVAVVVAVLLLTVIYRRRSRVAPDPAELPALPESLLSDSRRTWVVFTTPYCASCGPLEASLREADPESHVVKVDATLDLDLAARFRIRRAPTVLLASPNGQVQETFLSAEDVRAFLEGEAVSR